MSYKQMMTISVNISKKLIDAVILDVNQYHMLLITFKILTNERLMKIFKVYSSISGYVTTNLEPPPPPTQTVSIPPPPTLHVYRHNLLVWWQLKLNATVTVQKSV